MNLFKDVPSTIEKERFDLLFLRKGVRIERIVSRGQATPPGKWLRQRTAEWVIVLKGGAKLLFRGAKTPLRLTAGDFVFIPAGTAHRVEWTQPGKPTVWLAVHLNRSEKT